MSVSIEPGDTGPSSDATTEQPARPLTKAVAILGVVVGFALLIVPGFFALRSFRRWRAGESVRPTFAWICAAAGLPILAVGIWLLIPGPGPLIQDDFSAAQSDWPTASHQFTNGDTEEWGRVGQAFEIARTGAGDSYLGLFWSEAPRLEAAVEIDVVLVSGPDAETSGGVGCVDGQGEGFLFVIGPDGSFVIGRAYGQGHIRPLAEGTNPAIRTGTSKTNHILGECTGGLDPTRLRMVVNGTEVAETVDPDIDLYRPLFRGMSLYADVWVDGSILYRFDNAIARE